MCTNILLENQWGDLDIGRRIKLKWALKKEHMRMWAGFIWIWIGSYGRLVNVMNHWVPQKAENVMTRFKDSALLSQFVWKQLHQ
jgi:hypothetical protein